MVADLVLEGDLVADPDLLTVGVLDAGLDVDGVGVEVLEALLADAVLLVERVMEGVLLVVGVPVRVLEIDGDLLLPLDTEAVGGGEGVLD